MIIPNMDAKKCVARQSSKENCNNFSHMHLQNKHR
jgi:hypothetical protein